MINFKRGDTLYFYATFTNEDGSFSPVDNISCQLRRKSNKKLIDIFTVTTTTTEGQYKFSVSDTSDYPITELIADHLA